MIIGLYAALLRLYPRQFQAEFNEEMIAVFKRVAATAPGRGSKLALLLREIRDLPGTLFEAYAVDWLQGEMMNTINDDIQPSTRWQAFLGMLPFLVFGIISMFGKADPIHSFRGTYSEMAFYTLALTGLLIGWIRGFPVWSYSYLGWSLVFAWWWTDMRTHGFDWGYRIWIPFGITTLIALLWTRSLKPIKKLFYDIWNDWARLLLVMFTLGAWVALINYDENHHPWLMLLMLGSTLITSAGAWFFLRSGSLKGRALSVTGSFIAAVVLSSLAWSTGDWRTYYGWPEADTWYKSLGESARLLLAWFLILFWPALIALIRRFIPRSTL